MDTSKEYIKMCDDARKYLGYPLRCMGMPYLNKNIGEEIDRGYIGILIECGHQRDECTSWERVPLYTQDQLQEMTEYANADTYSGLPIMFHLVWEDLKHRKLGKINRDSGEQIWLAFIMRGKHNKTWDGNKWVD